MSVMERYEPTWKSERKGYVRCRALGHSWFDYDSNWHSKMGTPLTLRCERCGMERRDTVGFDGQLLSRYYIRPAHYVLRSDEDKPMRADFRLMLLAIRKSDTRKRNVS